MKSSLTLESFSKVLNAEQPAERRGLRRDHVRMLVLNRADGKWQHDRFYHLDQHLKAGDLLVLNSSRTIPAVLFADVIRADRIISNNIEVRLAHRKSDAVWEAFILSEKYVSGDALRFSMNLSAIIQSPQDKNPFVTIRFSLSGTDLYNEIYASGEPIRYEYIDEPWDLQYYQTVYGTTPGSVEMPSAGRAFSWELLFRLQKNGVKIAYLQLHTGLSYLGDDKWHISPRENEEEFHIPEDTATIINRTKEEGGRIIAVGTTVVRSLESAVDIHGHVVAQSGWTNLHIKKNSCLQVVEGLITGFHEPQTTHLDLLSAFVHPDVLGTAYEAAIKEAYLWHEFGDVNLII